MTKPTGVTLFSGLGSSSKALCDLGHVVLAHDLMPEAVASLRANGFDAAQVDVRDIDFTAPVYDEVEVLVGGPPCQPFSQGGRNAGADDKRDMIPDFIRAIRDIRPRLFVMENVKGLAGPRHRDYLQARLDEMQALGYAVEARVLDCADYGVAQSRKRLFVVGVDRDNDLDAAAHWPEAQPQVTMAEALGWDEYECEWRNLLAPERARDAEAALWPLGRPSTTVVGSFRPEVQAAPGYRRAGDGPRQNAPGSVVTTPEERLVLQGLPRDWKVAGSKTKRDLQIGNSCPTSILRALVAANSKGA